SDALKTIADTLKSSRPNCVAVLAAVDGDKITLCAACGAEAVKNGVKAGSVVKETAALVGGSGGGKPDIAMAGGKDVAKLSDALKAVAEIVKKLLS
ncbi:MAG: DHHA1 domain-containing protein, partial [Oscillospiraceae bacterium]